MADLSPADVAVKYLLDRIQTDPDLYFYAGPMTQSFALLCAAEAARTGESPKEVELRRGKDLQPAYRRREAEVVELRDKVADLRDGDAEDTIAELKSQLADALDREPESRHCPHCQKCSECGLAYPCVCPEPTEPPRAQLRLTGKAA